MCHNYTTFCVISQALSLFQTLVYIALSVQTQSYLLCGEESSVPVLANLYLNSVDGAMEARWISEWCATQDLVILCCGREEAEGALRQVQGQMTEKGLRMNPEKTRLVDVRTPGQGFDFLGYHFEGGTRWPRKKSLKKLKEAIREKTGRSNGKSLECIIDGGEWHPSGMV